jgi:apolipoprotein N-acyltransferase
LGTIPAGVKDLKISLDSEADLDIQLYVEFVTHVFLSPSLFICFLLFLLFFGSFIYWLLVSIYGECERLENLWLAGLPV